MKILTDIVARILYVLPLIAFGFGHFANADAMAGMVPFPGGVFWLYLTGAALIAAAISILIKKMASLSTLLLGIMLILFALIIWAPNAGADQAAMSNMFKDLGLAGASFFMSGVFRKEEQS